MFVDRVRVHLRGGNGGAGVVSFVRAKGRPLGKPIGGSGGDGGDVIVEARSEIASLLRYRRNPHYVAGDGTHGRGELRQGRRGEDLILTVPLGTVISDEEGVVLADLVEPGQKVVVASGGKGGRGNAALVSPKLKAPSICEQGEYGSEKTVEFELKLMADAALVGFPNAGKSTFISKVSAAKPKIADYPFTTLEPNLGVVSFDEREFVLADIPGLIEGASEGKGLGHEFLRHIERASVLVVILDPSPIQPEPPRRQLEILLAELDGFQPELLNRPRLVLMAKADLGIENTMVGTISISSITGEGVNQALHSIADLVEQAERARPDRLGYVLHRPLEDDVSVEWVGDAWRVEGVSARRSVRFDDLTNPQAARLAARRLENVGVDAALAKAGAVAGDLVRIGDLEFEYVPIDSNDELDGEE